jgi:DNA invertase Pin-like site-specific DNA recombinase
VTKKPKSNRKPRYLEYVKNVPEEERNEIVDRYRAGEKIFQIAKALKRAPETITAALYMSGQSTPTFIVPNDRKEIIKLFKEGLPYVSIQKRFYLSQSFKNNRNKTHNMLFVVWFFRAKANYKTQIYNK